MWDVFLSHAGEDKKMARIIGRALAEENLEVFFDEENIRSGDALDRTLAESLDASKTVLVLWSRRSVNKDWVKHEAAVGKSKGRLLAAVIDEISQADLPEPLRGVVFRNLQGFDGGEHDGFTLLLKDIRARLRQGSQSHQTSVNDDLLPHLAGRSVQRNEIGRHIGGQGEAQDRVKPLLLVANGPSEECLDQYQRRLIEFDLREEIRDLCGVDGLDAHRLDWPPRRGDAASRFDELVARILRLFEQRGSAAPDALARAIRLRKKPQFVGFHLTARNWTAGDGELLARLGSHLQEVEALPMRQRLIVLVSIEYEVSLLARLLGQRWAGARRNLERLDKLHAEQPQALKVLSELTPLEFDEAMGWVDRLSRSPFSLTRYDDLRAAVSQAYRSRVQGNLSQLPMQRFAEFMRPALRQFV